MKHCDQKIHPRAESLYKEGEQRHRIIIFRCCMWNRLQKRLRNISTSSPSYLEFYQYFTSTLSKLPAAGHCESSRWIRVFISGSVSTTNHHHSWRTNRKARLVLLWNHWSGLMVGRKSTSLLLEVSFLTVWRTVGRMSFAPLIDFKELCNRLYSFIFEPL